MNYKKWIPIIAIPTIAVPAITVPIVLWVPLGKSEKMIIEYQAFNENNDDDFIVKVNVGRQYFLKTMLKFKGRGARSEANNFILKEALKKIQVPAYVKKAQKKLQDNKDLPKKEGEELEYVSNIVDPNNGSLEIRFPVKSPADHILDFTIDYQSEINKYIESLNFRKSINELISSDQIIGYELNEKFQKHLKKEKKKLLYKLSDPELKVEKNSKIRLDFTGYYLNEFSKEEKKSIDVSKLNIISSDINNEFKLNGSSKFIGKSVGDVVTFEKEIKDSSTDSFLKQVNDYIKTQNSDSENIDTQKNKKIIIYVQINGIESNNTKIAANDKIDITIKILGFEGKTFKGGTSKDYNLQLGKEQFIGEFEDQIIGMKAREKRNIFPTFPANYNKKELQGKTVLFKAEIKEFHENWNEEIDDDDFYKNKLIKEHVKIFDWKNPNNEKQKFSKTKADFEKIKKLIFYQSIYSQWVNSIITRLFEKHNLVLSKAKISQWYYKNFWNQSFNYVFQQLRNRRNFSPKMIYQPRYQNMIKDQTIDLINMQRMYNILVQTLIPKSKFEWSGDNAKKIKEIKKIIIKKIIDKINARILGENLKIEYM